MTRARMVRTRRDNMLTATIGFTQASCRRWLNPMIARIGYGGGGCGDGYDEGAVVEWRAVAVGQSVVSAGGFAVGERKREIESANAMGGFVGGNALTRRRLRLGKAEGKESSKDVES